MQNKNGDQGAPDNWENHAEASETNNIQPTAKPEDTQTGEKKVRKPLKLRPKAAQDFVPDGQSKDIMGDFFKEEIAQFLNQKSGKMFQSSVTISFKKPETKKQETANTTAAKEKPAGKESPVKKSEKELKEERKEEMKKAQEDNKRKSTASIDLS